jgi:rhodanese-related sulfurtransferase
MAELLLTTEEMRRIRESGEPVVVLDVRGTAAHGKARRRVEGDVRMHPSDVEERADELDSDAWILAYCTCLDDGLAVRAAEHLALAGFPRARAAALGLDGLDEAGFPVVRIETDTKS